MKQHLETTASINDKIAEDTFDGPKKSKIVTLEDTDDFSLGMFFISLSINRMRNLVVQNSEPIDSRGVASSIMNEVFCILL